MSAFGPKQTWTSALHMSTFGGKADIRKRSCLLSRSLLGAKRTSLFAAHMSASDPKRTSLVASHMSAFGGEADMTVADVRWLVPCTCLLLTQSGYWIAHLSVLGSPTVPIGKAGSVSV